MYIYTGGRSLMLRYSADSRAIPCDRVSLRIIVTKHANRVISRGVQLALSASHLKLVWLGNDLTTG